jgi:hypothetical protein
MEPGCAWDGMVAPPCVEGGGGEGMMGKMGVVGKWEGTVRVVGGRGPGGSADRK